MKSRLRRKVRLAIVAVAAYSVIVGVIMALIGNTGAGFGGDIYVIFVALPLFVISLALHSQSQGVQRTAAVASLVLALYWSAVMIGNWQDYSNRQRFLAVISMTPAILAFLAASLAELPTFSPRWRPPTGR